MNKLTNAERCRIWKKNNLERKREMDRVYNNKRNFGGKRHIVLGRDNWECQQCGMTQEQHFILFNKSLTIHHKDGKGSSSKEKNNDLDNLITLCVRCHAMIDGVQFVKGSNVNPKTGKGGRKKGTPNKPKKGSTNK